MKTLEERFWSKVAKAEGCWLWNCQSGTSGPATRPGAPNLCTSHDT